MLRYKLLVVVVAIVCVLLFCCYIWIGWCNGVTRGIYREMLQFLIQVGKKRILIRYRITWNEFPWSLPPRDVIQYRIWVVFRLEFVSKPTYF
jgi:hypothetical protein